jgi:phage shock protein PspC (stress-responsive transcriptional regulator)
MNCTNCQKEIAEQSNFCYFCGARQAAGAAAAGPPKRLTRSANDRVIGGVLGGFVDYIGADPTLVRLVFVLILVFTAVIPGLIAYVVAWFVIPEAGTSERPVTATRRRLARSPTDKKIGGVCGGLAEFLGVDSTIVRLFWALLTIIPGAVVGGVVAYFLAWILIPMGTAPYSAAADAHSAPAPQHS